jgi:hypothetical protein
VEKEVVLEDALDRSEQVGAQREPMTQLRLTSLAHLPQLGVLHEAGQHLHRPTKSDRQYNTL